jgi:hypothetical protein
LRVGEARERLDTDNLSTLQTVDGLKDHIEAILPNNGFRPGNDFVSPVARCEVRLDLSAARSAKACIICTSPVTQRMVWTKLKQQKVP